MKKQITDREFVRTQSENITARSANHTDHVRFQESKKKRKLPFLERSEPRIETFLPKIVTTFKNGL